MDEGNRATPGGAGLRGVTRPTTTEASSARVLLGDVRSLVSVAWSLDRGRMLVQMGLLALSGVVGGVGLALLVPIVNAVAGPEATVPLPVVGAVGLGDLPLWVLLVAFVGLVAAAAAIRRTSTVNSTRLQQRIVDRLRQSAFTAVLNADGPSCWGCAAAT